MERFPLYALIVISDHEQSRDSSPGRLYVSGVFEAIHSPLNSERNTASRFSRVLRQELADANAEVKKTQKLELSVAMMSKAKREVLKASAGIDEARREGRMDNNHVNLSPYYQNVVWLEQIAPTGRGL